MHLKADKVYACPDAPEREHPVAVGFRDSTQDHCLILERFADPTQDNGLIELIVKDQINARTKNLKLHLENTHCRVTLDEDTANQLEGIQVYDVEYQTDKKTYKSLVRLLHSIFRGLPGLNIVDEQA